MHFKSLVLCRRIQTFFQSIQIGLEVSHNHQGTYVLRKHTTGKAMLLESSVNQSAELTSFPLKTEQIVSD